MSVRNLTVTPLPGSTGSKGRGKTIDDEDLPNTLQSPSKTVSAREAHRSLHPSRSVTDLKSQEVDGVRQKDKGAAPETAAATTATVVAPRRRRSTLPWNDPNPRTRQIKLEDITSSRMADSWFSIHCEGCEEPVYISEVVENATNPSFRSFDLNICGPLVSRLDRLTLKLWMKPTKAGAEYVLLVELQLHLQSLQFLGKSLDNFHQPLPSNSILFHFSDGVYTNLTDLPPNWSTLSTGRLEYAPADDSAALPTSSYDALMRLANLDECIQDALATREKLEAQMNTILQQNERALDTISEASRAQEKLAQTRHAVAAERRQIRAAAKRKEELVASIKTRKEAMQSGRSTQEKTQSHLPDAQLKLGSSRKLQEANTEDAKGQIRRISEDLLAIYPIEPIPDEPLSFTIAGAALPNSHFAGANRDVVAAALGHTAHLVYLLSFYLSIPIPYPVKPYLSNSLIHDPVSVSLPQRTYPLYPVNVHYRFEYGVFLLNKNVEILLNKQGLRAFDIRHTLPNLKYLLYVLTAGTSDIPARKAGGIRGLYPYNASRRGSANSSVYAESSLPPKSLDTSPSQAHMNGEATGSPGGGGSGNTTGKKPVSPLASFASPSFVA